MNNKINEAKEPDVIAQLRKIVKDKQNALVVDTKSKKKVRVDMQSASLMVQVYDALKQQSNKDKFVKGGIVSMGHMAYKLMKKESVVSEEAKRDYKDEYKKFQSSDKSKKYRAELNKYNRDKGTYGNGDGKDASHKGGKIVGFESEKKNRGRAEKSRLKKEVVITNEGQFSPIGYAKRVISGEISLKDAMKDAKISLSNISKLIKKLDKSFNIQSALLAEAKMKLGKDSANFKVFGTKSGLILMAATSKDLDSVQDAIVNDVDVKGELRKTLEKQLKIPVNIDRSYEGAGYRFSIDFTALAKQVK